MSTAPFRRHAHQRVDAAIHHAYQSLSDRPAEHAAFARLVASAHARSDLLRALPARDGACAPVDALRNLARFHRDFLADPEAWPGARGHPLRVVDGLARHVLGRYPTPRFLASVWFGDEGELERQRRRWFVAHARGERFRSLDVPVVMTRRMEHVFLRSPDHLEVGPALRRAEVIGLGGSPELAEAVMATLVARTFARGEHWRTALAWLVSVGDELDLAQVGPIVDYADRVTEGPHPLHGRGYPAVVRDVAAWHAALARRRPRTVSWPRSRWNQLAWEGWSVVELLDSDQLVIEGRALRHCVAIYARRCARGSARIWSLRRREDELERPVLTIEVDPHAAMIVQLRGLANRRATGQPLELVRMWAAREQLAFSQAVKQEVAAAQLQA